MPQHLGLLCCPFLSQKIGHCVVHSCKHMWGLLSLVSWCDVQNMMLVLLLTLSLFSSLALYNIHASNLLSLNSPSPLPYTCKHTNTHTHTHIYIWERDGGEGSSLEAWMKSHKSAVPITFNYTNQEQCLCWKRHKQTKHLEHKSKRKDQTTAII